MNVDFNLNLRPSRPAPRRFRLFALGFRPFFLGAGVWAVLDILLWLAVYRGARIGTPYFDPVTWHAHEMVFGFAVAVIAGFLLTAVTNWTGHPGVRGRPLAGLFALWVAGRLVPFCGGWLPSLVIACVDLAFLPALALLLVPALRKGKRINWIFPGMLLGLAVANGVVHVPVLGDAAWSGRTGLYAGVYFVLLMIQVMAGRVFPFFTERAIPGATSKRNRWADALAIGSYIVFVLADLFVHVPAWTSALALLAAFAHGWRLCAWYARGVFARPILWVLYTAYAWLIVGFLLRAGVGLLPVSPFAALHAWTVGGMGVVCLGMMTRVTRGHTGRPMMAGRLGGASFVCINVAALIRVAGTVTASEFYGGAIAMSALFWALAYALFLYAHVPMLVYSRPDGKPG